MTVNEVIILAATYLGLEDVVRGYVENGTGDGQETKLFLDCFNLVENEIALDYMPLYAEEEINSLTGKVNYNALKRAVVRIMKVTDTNGELKEYTLFPDCIKTSPGKMLVRYTYTPEAKYLGENSDFESSVSARLISYGVAAEYATIQGLYEEASIYDKKYKDALTAAYTVRPCAQIPSRRWV